MQALLEIVALFASLGLAGFYFIAKAAKRGEARRQEVQAAMADLTMVQTGSSSASGLAAKEPGVQE